MRYACVGIIQYVRSIRGLPNDSIVETSSCPNELCAQETSKNIMPTTLRNLEQPIKPPANDNAIDVVADVATMHKATEFMLIFRMN